ncbi:tRNA (adenosine(37)-N6)-dimethylallyltransferase MiaA [Alkaliphilus peptidifermentans]|uniref:tRNA dimethylallyltransferase n=1 Tax=Alkaliphilus peptidifermentans DSM 18978 TaxID=1120976 RepID=A0A1G5KKI5_9FIRM|nr:tRNA (adenosine(37)-N6)-dimethylallyltransferase MiaA [Alkaliphilus peptidifermentans]SCZ01122.1 tRNA dimethylallyltransferase [Alkaliphilus peptidifermentans DSM 18978]
MKPKVLMIFGPTAVGKTDTSINIAQSLNGEIISADSMQIYHHMNIGTAKPSLEEQDGIPHHLLDIVYPDEEFSVADFQHQAKNKIIEIHAKNKLPILVGGTGLYFNSLIYNMDFTNTISNWKLRSQLEDEARTKGNLHLHSKLKEIDPAAAVRIHPNNVKRVIRALEVNYEGGENMGDFSEDITLNNDYDFYIIGLTRDREELYDRINQRVDIMVKQGLVEEVQFLLDKGYSRDLTAFKGLGYKEIIGYLKGEYSLDAAIETLKRDTRRYAKRQLTWFRRYEAVNWYNLSEYPTEEKLFKDILKEVEGHFYFISNT